MAISEILILHNILKMSGLYEIFKKLVWILVTFKKSKIYFKFDPLFFSIDGGVANNDFVVQLISTLTNKKIERRNDVESAALGVAFLAGLHSGIHSLLFIR